MNDRDDRSEFLRALTDEAREHLTPERMMGKSLDWQAVDDRLFARLAAEPAPASRGGLRLLPAAAIVSVLAMAASAMFVIGHHDAASPDAYKPVTAADSVADASSFLRHLGQGEVRIGGKVASADTVAHVGDTVTVDGGRAVFARKDGDARVATWSLASGGSGQARARLVAEDRALVVALEDGAVEAEVRSSDRQSFAVDVGRSRVSVKGTHLRVERHGNKVSVDLTRGVVSVGSTSSFAGTLISAPAHVELDTEHPEAFDVDRVHVRPAESFEEQTAVLAPTPNFDPASADPKASHGNPVAPASAPVKAPPTVDAPLEVDPRTRILAGVRNCVLTHGDGAVGSSGSGVAVSVSSKLDLALDASGAVRSARFSPPLHPDAQSCAAEIIYKVRFDGGATSVSLPIDIKR